MRTQTVTVQIGNSDDKLTQKQWAQFVNTVESATEKWGLQTHFFSASSGHKPWQNACWVLEISPELFQMLLVELSEIAKNFRQDSIAVTTGETIFVKPNGSPTRQ